MNIIFYRRFWAFSTKLAVKWIFRILIWNLRLEQIGIALYDLKIVMNVTSQGIGKARV